MRKKKYRRRSYGQTQRKARRRRRGRSRVTCDLSAGRRLYPGSSVRVLPRARIIHPCLPSHCVW